MVKVVLKSAAYSLLCSVLLFIIGFGMSCLIAPKKVADFVVKINLNKFSAILTISEFNRTGDINDLALAVERSSLARLHKETSLYAKKLIENENYADFTAWKSDTTDYDYANFIESNYVYSSYKIGNTSELFDFAVASVEKHSNAYAVNNAVSRYIDAFQEGKDRGLHQEVLEYLEGKFIRLKASEAPDVRALRRVCLDLYRIYDTVGDEVNRDEWEDKYNELSKI